MRKAFIFTVWVMAISYSMDRCGWGCSVKPTPDRYYPEKQFHAEITPDTIPFKPKLKDSSKAIIYYYQPLPDPQPGDPDFDIYDNLN